MGESTKMTQEEYQSFEKHKEATSTRSALTTAQKKELWNNFYAPSS